MKITLFLIFEELSLKQAKSTFLEGGRPTLKLQKQLHGAVL